MSQSKSLLPDSLRGVGGDCLILNGCVSHGVCGDTMLGTCPPSNSVNEIQRVHSQAATRKRLIETIKLMGFVMASVTGCLKSPPREAIRFRWRA
jgi:hypothetical protein